MTPSDESNLPDAPRPPVAVEAVPAAEYEVAPTVTQSVAAPIAPLETSPPTISTSQPAAAVVTVEKPRRLAALDVFRGITIAAMVLANNASGRSYAPLEHVEWHGWTPTDLIFPFFLFIVGVATPFSLARRESQSMSRGALVGQIWVRALALIVVGLLLNASNLPWPWRNLPPHGFAFTKAFRIVGFFGVYAAILLMLVPWRWRRVSTWLPVAIAILLIGYGVAMHFVHARAVADGWPESTFGGGLFNPDKLRIPGVLQRIGLCYGFAATLAVFVCWRTILVSIVALFAAYSTLMLAVPIHNDAGEKIRGSLTMEDNVARRVDVAVLERHVIVDGTMTVTQKHTYRDYPDNEGILSTLPAIGSALIGILVGCWLRTRRTASEHGVALLAMGVPTLVLGLVLDHALMPINKNLWTPSFTVFSAGMAMLGLGFIFWLTDVLGRRAWAWPFKVMGMNAIAAFVASAIVVRITGLILVNDVPHFDPNRGVVLPANDSLVNVQTYATHRVFNAVHHASDWLQGLNAHVPTLATTENLSLAWALCFLSVIFLITLVLYGCRIFVKV